MRDDLKDFEAWLEEKTGVDRQILPEAEPEPPRGAFAQLGEAGERCDDLLLPCLLRMVGCGTVLLTVDGVAGPLDVVIESLEREGENVLALCARREGQGVLPVPAGAQIVWPLERQIVSVTSTLTEVEGSALRLEAPTGLSFFPGRAFPRVTTDFGGTAWMKVDGQGWPVRVLDASYGGLGLIVPRPALVGVGQRVGITARWQDTPLELDAEVVYVAAEGNGWRLGLRFVGTYPEVMRLVRATLAGGLL